MKNLEIPNEILGWEFFGLEKNGNLEIQTTFRPNCPKPPESETNAAAFYDQFTTIRYQREIFDSLLSANVWSPQCGLRSRGRPRVCLPNLRPASRIANEPLQCRFQAVGNAGPLRMLIIFKRLMNFETAIRKLLGRSVAFDLRRLANAAAAR